MQSGVATVESAGSLPEEERRSCSRTSSASSVSVQENQTATPWVDLALVGSGAMALFHSFMVWRTGRSGVGRLRVRASSRKPEGRRAMVVERGGGKGVGRVGEERGLDLDFGGVEEEGDDSASGPCLEFQEAEVEVRGDEVALDHCVDEGGV